MQLRIMQGEANDMNSGRYVKESYTEGDACDLTGGKRQTEVTAYRQTGGLKACMGHTYRCGGVGIP